MKIKQAEIRAWLSGAIREQTRLYRECIPSVEFEVLKGKLAALDAVEEAMHGNMGPLQSLAGVRCEN